MIESNDKQHDDLWTNNLPESQSKAGCKDGSASGSRAQLMFWSLWPHNCTTFTFRFDQHKQKSESF